MNYAVNTIYPCIQGEGHHTGTPMVMIRLQGCDVGCPWCDTKETWGLILGDKVENLAEADARRPRWTSTGVQNIIARVLQYPLRWALISGGEPADQALGPLVDALHRHHFKTALETSGTATGHLGAGFDWVTVSPKWDMPGGKPVLDSAMIRADEIKAVIGKQEDLDRVVREVSRLRGIGSWQGEVSLQPVSQSKAATQLCVDACMKHNWRLSCQLHKYLALP